ncbi:MAG: DUF2934 domain-containing protein [Opitutae bacterium]|nr:DUF2934 domain-containing protein [Opitutae bacterium]
MTLLINYTESPALEPTEDEIRERAYQLWLSEGKPEGRDFDHWLAARQALLHEALTAKQALESIAGPDGPRPLKATVKLHGSRGGRHLKVNATAQAARPEVALAGGRAH